LDSRTVTVGGTTAADRNVISANGGFGILADPLTTGLVVQGNYVGTDATGTLARGNTGVGVYVQSPGAVVGGPTSVYGTGAGNVVSANGTGPGSGLGIVAVATATGAVIQGNVVGLNAAGTAVLNDYQSAGVYVQGAANVLVGGTATGAGNLVSGNVVGVELDQGASHATVAGNRIGTDA